METTTTTQNNFKGEWIDKLGGSKFLFAMLSLILAFILTVIKLLSGQEFVTFAIGIGGTFVLGNVVNQISNDIASKDTTPKSTSTVTTSTLTTSTPVQPLIVPVVTNDIAGDPTMGRP